MNIPVDVDGSGLIEGLLNAHKQVKKARAGVETAIATFTSPHRQQLVRDANEDLEIALGNEQSLREDYIEFMSEYGKEKDFEGQERMTAILRREGRRLANSITDSIRESEDVAISNFAIFGHHSSGSCSIISDIDSSSYVYEKTDDGTAFVVSMSYDVPEHARMAPRRWGVSSPSRSLYVTPHNRVAIIKVLRNGVFEEVHAVPDFFSEDGEVVYVVDAKVINAFEDLSDKLSDLGISLLKK